ncbi:hypothetical protein UlMin_008027 [Ulmus minor]
MAVQDPETSHRDLESFNEGGTNTLLANTRCCFCFGSRRSSSVGLAWWERLRTSSTSTQNDRWWFRGFRAVKKLREWSEIVAGPKWKTFIRRLNRNRSTGGGSGGGGGNRHGKFQYDPLSYSLNFDQGPGQNGSPEEDDFGGFRNFSVRYASPVPAPVQARSSSASLENGKDVAVYG